MNNVNPRVLNEVHYLAARAAASGDDVLINKVKNLANGAILTQQEEKKLHLHKIEVGADLQCSVRTWKAINNFEKIPSIFRIFLHIPAFFLLAPVLVFSELIAPRSEFASSIGLFFVVASGLFFLKKGISYDEHAKAFLNMKSNEELKEEFTQWVEMLKGLVHPDQDSFFLSSIIHAAEHVPEIERAEVLQRVRDRIVDEPRILSEGYVPRLIRNRGLGEVVFNDRLVADRPLSAEIQLWVNEYKRAFPEAMIEMTEETLQPLLSLDKETQRELRIYLGRIRGVADYNEYNDPEAKKNVISRVKEMLELSCKNEKFKNNVLARIHDGNEACGDRTLLVFNDIEIEHQVFQTLHDEEALKKLLIRAQRYEILKQKGISLNYHEGVAAALSFHTKLKDVEGINLPISSKYVLFPQGSITRVTPVMLEAAKNELLALSDEQLLSRSERWAACQQSKNTPEAERLTEKYTNFIMEAEEYFGQDSDDGKAEFLLNHTGFAIFLHEHEASIKNYPDAANFISQQRIQALASIGL